MAVTNIGAVKQAFVRALRDITDLKSAVGNEFHEGISPDGAKYPVVVWSVASSRRSYAWGTPDTLITTIYVLAYSDDPVVASNLDLLILDGLQDKVLSFDGSGHSTLFCRRLVDLSSADVDGAGKKVYGVGGSYQLWTT